MKYFVLLCVICFCAARKLPSFINPCKAKHEDVGKCILQNVNQILRPKLLEGIPEMGIPSIHPLLIRYAEASLGDGFKGSVKDLKLWDMESFVIEDLRVNLEELSVELKIKMPTVRAETEYNVQGNLLILTLDGTGPGQINFTNIEAIITANGTEETKHGKTHFVMKNLDIKPTVEKMSIKLDNIFPNNPEITDFTNELFNDNDQVLVEEFSPLVVEIAKNFISGVIENVFSKYPAEVLFPGY